MVPLRELAYLPRREFKIHGSQIGDHTSDISFNHVCKQIDKGVRENFSENEVVRGVLRIIKPSNYKDMLTNKELLTELFQELLGAKQSEQEIPQQFLYRMIGLKQKILRASKQASNGIHYESNASEIKNSDSSYDC